MSSDKLLDYIRSSNISGVRNCLKADSTLLNKGDDRLNMTPIFHAVMLKTEEILSLLLSSGGDPNIGNSTGDTPLHQSVEDSDYNITQILLKSNADPNSKNLGGETPLHVAAYRGDSSILELLLDFGSDPNTQTSGGLKTALHISMEEHSLECAKKLLEFKADPYILDKENKTSFLIALEESMGSCLEDTTFINSELISDLEASRSKNSLLKSFSLDLGTTQGELELLNLLGEFGLEKFFSNLAIAGYSRLDTVIDIMQSEYPLTLDTLKTIGISDIGSRMSVLIVLDRKAGKLPRLSIRHQIDPEKNKTRLVCCNYPCFSYSYVDTIDQWLRLIGLKHLTVYFKDAGFVSLDLMYLQMHSKYPLTSKILEEIGIENTDEQKKVMKRLREDTQVYIGNDLVAETVSENVSCSCSII